MLALFNRIGVDNLTSVLVEENVLPVMPRAADDFDETAVLLRGEHVARRHNRAHEHRQQRERRERLG